jgi:sulfotransferase family protein
VPDPRYVFILGTGRCGSTLLAAILAAHPDIGWVSSLQTPLGRLARALHLDTRRSEGYEAYGPLGEQVSPMLVDPFRDLTAEDATPWLERRLREFFSRHAKDEGRPVFMYKFTGWPRARLLATVFPQAKFIHVFRDGRSVANSYLQTRFWRGYRGESGWTFGHLSDEERRDWVSTNYSWPYLAGLEWKRLMAAFEDARDEIGAGRWIDLRYEDLVARPKEESIGVLRFAGLDGWTGLERRLGALRISEGRSDAYRHELRPEDVALLERALAPTLERWGYEVGVELRT